MPRALGNKEASISSSAGGREAAEQACGHTAACVGSAGSLESPQEDASAVHLHLPDRMVAARTTTMLCGRRSRYEPIRRRRRAKKAYEAPRWRDAMPAAIGA